MSPLRTAYFAAEHNQLLAGEIAELRSELTAVDKSTRKDSVKKVRHNRQPRAQLHLAEHLCACRHIGQAA